MNPLLDGVAGQTINDEFGRNCAGDDADALADFQNSEKRKNVRRKRAKCADGLRLQSVERDCDTGVRRHRYAESDQDTTGQGAHEVDQHAANGSDKNRHGLTPCNDAKREQKRDGDQQVTEVFEIGIDHRKRQRDGLTPNSHIEV